MDFIDFFFFFVGLKLIINFFFEIKNAIVSFTANNDLSRYGKSSWALVTACTDGIGQGFAVTLAKKGFNIVQVGRNPEKLSAQASDLHSKYGVQVKSIIKDFSDSAINPIDFFTDIFEQTKDLDVSILINNVGVASGKQKFADFPLKSVLNELSLNIFPITFLSRLYLPKLMKRDQGGVVLNLSTVGAHGIFPFYIQYCSGKAFDYYLTELIDIETSICKAGKKLDVLCLQPGYTDTPLTKRMKGKFLEISKYECAEGSLKCLGSSSRTGGHWKHLITNFVFMNISSISWLVK